VLGKARIASKTSHRGATNGRRLVNVYGTVNCHYTRYVLLKQQRRDVSSGGGGTLRGSSCPLEIVKEVWYSHKGAALYAEAESALKASRIGKLTKLGRFPH
jgi:hypothetical protein